MTDIKATIPLPPGSFAAQPSRETIQPEDRETAKISAAEQSRDPGDPLAEAARLLERHFKELAGENRTVRVEQNEEADRVVYKVIDKNTEEVIRQFPPETILKLIAYYRRVEGLGIDNSV